MKCVDNTSELANNTVSSLGPKVVIATYSFAVDLFSCVQLQYLWTNMIMHMHHAWFQTSLLYHASCVCKPYNSVVDLIKHIYTCAQHM